jgi:hypothetical protein
MGERRAYRGRSSKEAIAAYHPDALWAAQSGYVPVEEKWSQAFGLAILTVTYEHRPAEVADVLRALTSSPAIRPTNRLRHNIRRHARTALTTVVALIIVVVTLVAPTLLGWTPR